ncbi:MAG: peptidoglycan DD-metalloendopeptidase family protein [Paludibacteraceae bacterium]|nr:peptidoglycan DD-metalloendopeptidase family protein [Paludibacteraceae bacterium]
MKRIFALLFAFGTILAATGKDVDNIFGIEEVEFPDAQTYEDELDFDEDIDEDSVVTIISDSSLFNHCQVFDTTRYEGVYNKVWSTSVVNPYNINLYKMKDTVKIDLSGYTHPFLGRITSNFGMRSYRYHYGTDVKLLVGDTIRAAFDGVVRISKWGKGYGYYILLRHDNGLETVYGHCSKLLVSTDTYVKSGDPIALGGNTGRSTGSHLHYEIRYVGNAINPIDVIDFETGKPRDGTLVIDAKTFKYKGVVLETRYYTVRKGDTLSGIAKKQHTSVSKICKLNNITTKTVLKIGRKLRVN